MTTPQSETEALKSTLDNIPRAHRAVFAASCAEQLVPSYRLCTLVTGWGDESTLREALDEIWNLSAGTGADEHRIHDLVGRAVQVAPGDQDEDQPGQNLRNYWVGPAQDAVTSVTLALKCLLNEDSSPAMRAGGLALNGIRDYLEVATVPFPLPGQAGDYEQLHAWIERSPLLAQERERQRLVADALRSQPTLERELLETIRSTAVETGLQLLRRDPIRDILVAIERVR